MITLGIIQKKYLLFFGSTFILSPFLGCSSANYDYISTGDFDSYNPGLPHFSMDATGHFLSFDDSRLTVYLSVPYNALIFRRDESQSFTALFSITINIIPENDTPIEKTTTAYNRTVTLKSYSDTFSGKSELITHNQPIPTGNYSIQAEITDESSRKTFVRELSLSIPDPHLSEFTVSDLRLTAQFHGDDIDQPLLTYQVPQNLDSLFANFQIISNSTPDSITLKTSIVRFKTDTTYARPPYYLTPNQASLAWRGIDFGHNDTIYTSITLIQSKKRVVTIRNSVPLDYKKGNYRVIVEAVVNDTTETIRKARDFAIRSETYPKVTSLQDLSESLVYIAYRDEYENIMKTTSVSERKKAIDRFWNSLYNSEQQAQRMLNVYYTRVEDANMLFSTFKEGWKTDMGMIYILFGAPVEIEYNVETILWSYSFSRVDERKVFYFQRAQNQSGYFPYPHYILLRSPIYEQVYMAQKEYFRDGSLD